MLMKLYINTARLGIVLIAFLINYTAAIAAAAGGETIQVKTNVPNGPIDQYVAYYLEDDSELSLKEILSSEYSDKFRPIETATADFGYFEEGIWLRASVHNLDAVAQERLLVLHTNFMPEMNVYWVSEGRVEILLDQDTHTKFGARAIPYHHLVAPLTIEESQKGEIFIRYTSEGNTVLPLSLETPLSFASTTNYRVTVDFMFYGVMAMFICASIIGRIFWANPTFIAYSLYAGIVLLYIFQRDGYAFQYLWPNAPVWNTFSSLPIGAALPAFAAIFTRVYLNTKKIHPSIDKILLSVVVMQCAVVLSSAVIGPSAAKKIAVLSTTLSVVVFLSIGIAAYMKYGRRTLFFVIGWLGILCASLVMTFVHWANMDISRAQSLDVMRVAMVFDALMMGLASVFTIVDLQRAREMLDQERIAILDTNLQLHDRLARLEQKYHLAQTLAETNNQLLVDTTHDLRQPLYALRAAMGDLVQQKAPAERVAEIKQSFKYIEELVETALENAIEKDESGGGVTDEPEATHVNKLLSALETMFEADAHRQSIDLKVMPSTQVITIRPFPVLRIMSNFVSNAVRYSAGRRVLVGARRNGRHVSLEVHDTGPGMSTEQLAVVKQRHVRGDATHESNDGKGVGLSIVAKLALEQNFQWTIESREGSGTTAKLLVPATADD